MVVFNKVSVLLFSGSLGIYVGTIFAFSLSSSGGQLSGKWKGVSMSPYFVVFSGTDSGRFSDLLLSGSLLVRVLLGGGVV